MKGDITIFALLAAAIAVAVVVIIEVYMIGTVGGADWNKTVNMDLTPPPITLTTFVSLESFPTGSLPNATRIISKSNESYSTSEVACDIAKDVYNDFTTWGEFHRGPYFPDTTDPNFKPYLKLNDKFLCEYYNASQGAQLGYFCLVSYGLFNFSSTSRTLTQTNRENLTQAKCCLAADNTCGCTLPGGVEHKLDEVCLNEVLVYTKYKGNPFCTRFPGSYIRMGEPGTSTWPAERLKFGNRFCYANPNNCLISEEGYGGWCTTLCDVFCDATGNRVNWPDDTDPIPALSETDYDRILWWADSSANKYYVNDSWLMKPDPSIGWMNPDYDSSTYEVRDDGNLYFYQVIWWDLANNNWDSKWKRYSVIFSKVPAQEYTNLDKNNFINKFLNMFDNETKARITTAGRWWPELRTVYDGIINVTEDISLTELKLKLEALNFYADLKRCSSKTDCLDYNINMEDWGEFLFDWDMATGSFMLPNKNRLDIRTNLDGEWIPKGKYRVIARNWFSNYGYANIYDCTGKWCLNDRVLTVGRKIFNVSGACPAYVTQADADCGSGAGWGTVGSSVKSHIVVQKYADKSLIIYELGCSDSDKTVNKPDGINYNMYGEVSTSNNAFEGDYCDADGVTLHEKYCDQLGQISTQTYVCPGVCKDGACCVSNGGACTSNTDCCSGFKCVANVCNPTQCNDQIDNDNDGDIDLADPSCSNIDDDNECGAAGISCTVNANCCTPLTCTTDNFCGPTQCSDTLDNDNDGLIDLNDPDCSGASDNTECSRSGASCTQNINCCSSNCVSNICN